MNAAHRNYGTVVEGLMDDLHLLLETEASNPYQHMWSPATIEANKRAGLTTIPVEELDPNSALLQKFHAAALATRANYSNYFERVDANARLVKNILNPGAGAAAGAASGAADAGAAAGRKLSQEGQRHPNQASAAALAGEEDRGNCRGCV